MNSCPYLSSARIIGVYHQTRLFIHFVDIHVSGEGNKNPSESQPPLLGRQSQKLVKYRSLDVAQLVECLPGMHEALSSFLSTHKTEHDDTGL